MVKSLRDRRPMSLRLPVRQTVAFTISSGIQKQQCVLRTTYLATAHAMTYLKNNRPKIEQIAQKRWADGLVEDGVVYVDTD
jgi:hypothetical protein